MQLTERISIKLFLSYKQNLPLEMLVFVLVPQRNCYAIDSKNEPFLDFHSPVQ